MSPSKAWQLETLRRALVEAALPEPALAVREIELELPAPRVFVPRHLAATPMAGMVEAASPTERERIVASVSDALLPHASATGMRVPFRSWFALASL